MIKCLLLVLSNWLFLEINYLFIGFKLHIWYLKFIYSEKATKFCEISTVDLSYVLSNGQICSGDFAKFCGLLRIYQLYNFWNLSANLWVEFKLQVRCTNPLIGQIHELRMPREEIAFTARTKLQSQSHFFRYGHSIFCLPHRPNFSYIFDLYFHWVSVVRGSFRSMAL